MTSKYSFNCPECQKHFEIKGHWYNQMLMHWWLDCKYLCHRTVCHPKKWKKNDWSYFLKMIISFPPLLLLQILDIVVTPFRNL